MTVKANTDTSRKTQPGEWRPKARRQGERPDWADDADDDEIVYVPITSERPVWPRVFPGI